MLARSPCLPRCMPCLNTGDSTSALGRAWPRLSAAPSSQALASCDGSAMPQKLQQTSMGLACLLLLAAAATHASDVFVHDPIHGNVKMGVISNRCDNGKTNLEHDWDGLSDSRFTCTPSRRRTFDAAAAAVAACRDNCTSAGPQFHLAEPEQQPLHKCMGQAIRYGERLPTSGAHRPLWPVWGRYSYLPAQRWLHSLEHGGIAGLYHPCVPANLADAFAGAVAGCLRRHVIFADAVRLTPERPFALLAYRNKVEMVEFNLTFVQDFIVSHALNGREHLAKDGQYSLGLISRATIVSDINDSQLCPGRALNASSLEASPRGEQQSGS